MQVELRLVGDVKSMTAVMTKLGGSGVAAEVATPTRGRGRPTKEEVAARKAAEETEDDGLGFGTGGEEDDDETNGDEDLEETEGGDETEGEEEPEAPKTRKGASGAAAGKAAALTLEEDIIPAFQKFAKKHSREKAAKILAKYKAANVQKLDKKHYAEIYKILTKG